MPVSGGHSLRCDSHASSLAPGTTPTLTDSDLSIRGGRSDHPQRKSTWSGSKVSAVSINILPRFNI